MMTGPGAGTGQARLRKERDGLGDVEGHRHGPAPPLPLTTHTHKPPFPASVFHSVRNKEPMAPLDSVRYRLEPPPQARRGDVGAWKSSLDNAAAQLEHQHLRILNQELLLKYGDKAWRAQVGLGKGGGVAAEEGKGEGGRGAVNGLRGDVDRGKGRGREGEG